jgi:adenine deaminase
MVSISRNIKVPGKEVIRKLLSRDDVLGIGEAYWQGVMQRQEEFMPNFAEAIKAGKRLEGHSAQ